MTNIKTKAIGNITIVDHWQKAERKAKEEALADESLLQHQKVPAPKLVPTCLITDQPTISHRDTTQNEEARPNKLARMTQKGWNGIRFLLRKLPLVTTRDACVGGTQKLDGRASRRISHK